MPPKRRSSKQDKPYYPRQKFQQSNVSSVRRSMRLMTRMTIQDIHFKSTITQVRHKSTLRMITNRAYVHIDQPCLNSLHFKQRHRFKSECQPSDPPDSEPEPDEYDTKTLVSSLAQPNTSSLPWKRTRLVAPKRVANKRLNSAHVEAPYPLTRKQKAFIHALDKHHQRIYKDVAEMFDQPLSTILSHITGGEK